MLVCSLFYHQRLASKESRKIWFHQKHADSGLQTVLSVAWLRSMLVQGTHISVSRLDFFHERFSSVIWCSIHRFFLQTNWEGPGFWPRKGNLFDACFEYSNFYSRDKLRGPHLMKVITRRPCHVFTRVNVYLTWRSKITKILVVH